MFLKLLILLGILFIIDLVLLAFENLIINIAAALVGWLLGELILYIYKKLAPKNKVLVKKIKPLVKKKPAKK